MSYLYENYIYPNKLTNRMKITLIRAEKESRKEALSTLEADALIKKLKPKPKPDMYRPSGPSFLNWRALAPNTNI